MTRDPNDAAELAGLDMAGEVEPPEPLSATVLCGMCEGVGLVSVIGGPDAIDCPFCGGTGEVADQYEVIEECPALPGKEG